MEEQSSRPVHSGFQLKQQHQSYDRKLTSMLENPYPNADQQMEEVRLKKLKLQAKDKLASMGVAV